MILLTTVILLSMAAVLYFWDEIRNSYIQFFSEWIEECCGSDIKEICDEIFKYVNNSASYIRRNSKELKKLLNKIFLKHHLDYIHVNSTQTEIKETVVVRQKDGSFVQREVNKIVDNDDIPFSILQEMHKDPSKTYRLDANEVIEKRIDELLEN